MSRYVWILLPMFLVALLYGRPPEEERQRRQRLLARLDAALAKQTTDVGRFAHVRDAMGVEPVTVVRRQILLRASRLSGEVLEDWLIGLLRNEQDHFLRGCIATLLGKKGSEKSVGPLISTAYFDMKTHALVHDIGSQGTARREALFALAELGKRVPKARPRITAALRLLPARADRKADPEGIYDVRLQALYQLTGEAKFISPFFKWLESDDAMERRRGVFGFRFLKLRKAPPELIARLTDSSADVRGRVAMVLGMIGDVAAAPALLAAAENKELGDFTRVHAVVALGSMKAQLASGLMKQLAKDSNPTLAHHAAQALARIRSKERKGPTSRSKTSDSRPASTTQPAARAD